MQATVAMKSAGVAYLLWLFLGWIGAYRFYLEYPFSGLAMLVLFMVTVIAPNPFTPILLGLWWAFDLFDIPRLTRMTNERIRHECGLL